MSLVPCTSRVGQRSGGFGIRTADRNLTADHAVNATNARSRHISQSAESLVDSLTQTGLAELHPRGGVCVERAASRLTVRGVPQPEIYALGDPAAGSLFFTFGIQSLVDRGEDIAGDIAKSLQRDPAAHGAAYRRPPRQLVQTATRSSS